MIEATKDEEHVIISCAAIENLPLTTERLSSDSRPGEKKKNRGHRREGEEFLQWIVFKYTYIVSLHEEIG